MPLFKLDLTIFGLMAQILYGFIYVICLAEVVSLFPKRELAMDPVIGALGIKTGHELSE